MRKTKRKNPEAQIRHQLARIRMLMRIIEVSRDFIVVTDPRARVKIFNTGAERLLGIAAEEARGRNVLDFFVRADGSPDGGNVRDTLRNQQGCENLLTCLRRRDGRIIPVSLSLDYVRNGRRKVKYVVGVAKDISRELDLIAELQRKNRELEDLASRDVMINEIFNRRTLDRVLARETARARRFGSPIALVFVDADEFKKVNGEFGHQMGDEALRRIGAVLARVADPTDFVARYGGDEFVVLLPQRTQDEAAEFGEAVRGAILSEEILCPRTRRRLPVTVSVGVAALAGREADGEKLVYRADIAAHRAKAWRNRVTVWRPEESAPPPASRLS